MRTLVEQTAEAVGEWFGKLDAAGVDKEGVLPRPEDVYVLMGGVEAAGWLENLERPAVVVGTQDMLLSRALMRGYASSRALWPMEFAVLHEDAQWVFDEVQLMGAGRATSAQLEAFRRCEAARGLQGGRPKGCPSRSLWVSATLDPRWLETVDHAAPAAVARVDPKLEEDGRLARLVRARKTLSCSAAAPASSKQADVSDYVDALADSILGAHRFGCMTLVIVNRVARAQGLHAAIKEKLPERGQPAPTLALVHSRFRRADRRREMDKVADAGAEDMIVVATQAVEAGVDISAAVMFTELAPWSSMVQRFGRANRYAELDDGATVRWIDLLASVIDDATSDKDAAELARPYTVAELRAARERLARLTDVAPVHLPASKEVEPPRRVIRRNDLDDLFDTDPDLTGFDVDVSPYVRDAEDTDIRVFWRDLSTIGDDPPRPRAEELCAVPIGAAKDWLKKARRKRGGAFAFVRDPQWRRSNGETGAAPPGWAPLREDPWPGLTLLVGVEAGGYDDASGFTGDPRHAPAPVPDRAVPADTAGEEEGHDENPGSAIGAPVALRVHLRHVAEEAAALCSALDVDPETSAAIGRAARWHDLGKAHEVFQDTMRRGLDEDAVAPDVLLAKTVKQSRHGRVYFRHELASALAFLVHERWSRAADLIAYLIAAHHGKVRMNLRALPRETAPKNGDNGGARFARGVWEGDELPPFDLDQGERWEGGGLLLSIMELGWDEITHESWTERTRELLAQLGPFRLAWLETLLRVADWRASAKERNGSPDGW